MTPEIKVLHAAQRKAKNGAFYMKYLCLVRIGDTEFIRTFVVF